MSMNSIKLLMEMPFTDGTVTSGSKHWTLQIMIQILIENVDKEVDK